MERTAKLASCLQPASCAPWASWGYFPQLLFLSAKCEYSTLINYGKIQNGYTPNSKRHWVTPRRKVTSNQQKAHVKHPTRPENKTACCLTCWRCYGLAALAG